MAIAALTSRFATYYSRHGLPATAQRAGLALKRALFSNRQVVFYCDLASLASSQEPLPRSLKVERKISCGELSPQDLQTMIDFWNPKLARRRIEERFDNGASLWFIKFEDRLAGYGWTLQGRTVEPYYFPLGQQDAHLFDFHVFPQYRGRGMNPVLVSHILRSLAADGLARAFIDAAEWNQAQLSSLQTTPFRCYGYFRKWPIFHSTMVWWAGSEVIHQARTDGREPQPLPRTPVRSVRRLG